jgi:hypothetical protein
MKRLLILGLLVLFFIGCRKSNIGEYQNYVGNWTGYEGDVNYKLRIRSNGDSFYDEKVERKGYLGDKSSKSVSYKGKFVLENSTLKIGLKKLTIHQEPLIVNGTWVLKLNNIELKGK